MSSVEDLERRVSVLEQRARAGEQDMVGVQAHLHAISGSQDVILGTLRDHGRLLADHGDQLARHDARFDGVDARLDRMDGKLDLVLDWIQAQP